MMSIEYLEQQIDLLLKRDDLEAVIEILQSFLENRRDKSEMIAQSGRLYDLKRDIRLGNINWEVAKQERNRIRTAILDFYKDLKFISSQHSAPEASMLTGGANIVQNVQHIIGDVVGRDKVTIGDTTTSAQQRFEAAYELIIAELIKNLIGFSVLLSYIDTIPPKPFQQIEKRRVNETEIAYNERAHQYQYRYVQDFQPFFKQATPVVAAYEAHKVNLAHHKDAARFAQEAYDYIKSILFYLNHFTESAAEFMNIPMSDLALVEKLEYLYQSMRLNGQLDLANAAFQLYWLLSIKESPDLIQSYLQEIIPNIDGNTNEELKNALLQEVQRCATEKQAFLQKEVDKGKPVVRQDMERAIKDPFLQLLRKTNGLPPILTEAEYWGIQRKEINMEVTDLAELVRLAYLSFVESDGEATHYYLEKATRCKGLKERQLLFLNLSLMRLENPDIFEGSLGLMILEITPQLNFEKAGIKVGDVVYCLNQEVLLDPNQLAIALGVSANDPMLIKFYEHENQQMKTAIIYGGLPVGALLTPLITWSPHQL